MGSHCNRPRAADIEFLQMQFLSKIDFFLACGLEHLGVELFFRIAPWLPIDMATLYSIRFWQRTGDVILKLCLLCLGKIDRTNQGFPSLDFMESVYGIYSDIGFSLL